MHVQLANLIGSGMAALACAKAGGPAASRITDGIGAIGHLLRRGGQSPRPMIEAAARRIVREALSGTELPQTKLRHLELLPDVLAHHCHDLAPRLAAVDTDEARDHAAAMAAELMTAALDARTVSEDELSPQLAAALLRALLSSLLERREEIWALAPTLEHFVMSTSVAAAETATVATPAPAATSEPAPVAAADRLPLPPELLATLVRTLAEWDPRAVLDDGMARRKADELAGIVAALTPPERSDEDVHDRWREAIASLTVGRISEADRILGEAETLDIHASEEQPRNAKMHLARALQTRIVRGRIENMRFYGRRAIGHFAAAFRYLPIRDKLGRWQLTVMQARTLADHGRHFSEQSSLEEAIQIYEQAQLHVTPSANPREWLGTKVEQAEAQLLLATLSKRPSTLEPTLQTMARAIADPALAGESHAIAQLENLLGAMKWQVGRANADRLTMAEAANLKMAAMRTLEELGATAEAQAIEAELPSLLDGLDGPDAAAA